MSSPASAHDDQAQPSPQPLGQPLGYVPSDSLWRRYLRCHRAISRQVAHLHRAGGAAWTAGKLLYKMQNQRLFRAQFPSLGECAQGEWQLSPELLKGLLQLSQTHSQEEAAKAGALPLLVLQGLSEQGGTLEQVLKKAQPGQTDLQSALRAAKDAEQEGATKEQARIIYDNTLSRLKQEREQRTQDREAREQALQRKPFTPIDWLEPLEEGASADAAGSIERQTQLKAELRKTAPALRKISGGIRQLSTLFAKCGPEVRLKGAEPVSLMEDALSVYLHLPALLARMALHLPDETRKKWLHDLPGDPALVKAYERASQEPPESQELQVEQEQPVERAKRPARPAATREPRRRRSGLLVCILFVISLFGVPTLADPQPHPQRMEGLLQGRDVSLGTTPGRALTITKPGWGGWRKPWDGWRNPRDGWRNPGWKPWGTWVRTQVTWVETLDYLGRNPGVPG